MTLSHCPLDLHPVKKTRQYKANGAIAASTVLLSQRHEDHVHSSIFTSQSDRTTSGLFKKL